MFSLFRNWASGKTLVVSLCAESVSDLKLLVSLWFNEGQSAAFLQNTCVTVSQLYLCEMLITT